MTVCSPDAVIIGGGLAGASSAYALARRGLKVLLCEGESALAQRASGNRLALIMPYISDYSSPLERVYSTGFRFTIELLRSVFSEEGLLNQVGGIQLPTTTRLKKLIHDRTAIIGSTEIQRISALEGSELSGITISHPSLYAPESGYVSPVRMVEALLHWGAQTGELRMNTQVIDLKRDHTGWCCYLASGDTISTPNVIVCGAYESSALTPLSWLPLEPVRGQTVSVKSSPTSRALRTTISALRRLKRIAQRSFCAASVGYRSCNLRRPQLSPPGSAFAPQLRIDSPTSVQFQICRPYNGNLRLCSPDSS